MISENGLNQFIALYELKYSTKLERQVAFELFGGLISTIRLGLDAKQVQKIDSNVADVTIKANGER